MRPVLIIMGRRLRSNFFRLRVRPIIILRLFIRNQMRHIKLRNGVRRQLQRSIQHTQVSRRHQALNFTFTVNQRRTRRGRPTTRTSQLPGHPRATHQYTDHITKALNISRHRFRIFTFKWLVNTEHASCATANSSRIMRLARSQHPP